MDPNYTLGETVGSWVSRNVNHIEIRHQSDGKVFVIVNGESYEILPGHSLEGDFQTTSRRTLWLLAPLLLLALGVLGFIVGLELMR